MDLVAIFILQSATTETHLQKLTSDLRLKVLLPNKLLCTGSNNCIWRDLIKSFTQESVKIRMFKMQEGSMWGKNEVVVVFNANSLRHLVLHAKEHGVKLTIIVYRSCRDICKMQLFK